MKKYLVLVVSLVSFISSYGQNITTTAETFEGSSSTYKWITKKGKLTITDNPNISSGNASYTSGLIVKDDEADICIVTLNQKIDISKTKTIKVKIFASKDVKVNFLLGKKSDKTQKLRARANAKGNSTWKEFTLNLDKEIKKQGIKELTFDFFKITVGKDKKSTEKGYLYIDDIQFVK